MVTGDSNSERLSEIFRRKDELKASALNDPLRAEKVLNDTLLNLQIAQKDQSAGDKGLSPHSEELVGDQIEWTGHYSTLIQFAFDSIAIIEDGRIVEAHEKFADANGYDLSELIGRPVTDFLVPEEYERVIQALRSGQEHINETAQTRRMDRHL